MRGRQKTRVQLQAQVLALQGLLRDVHVAQGGNPAVSLETIQETVVTVARMNREERLADGMEIAALLRRADAAGQRAAHAEAVLLALKVPGATENARELLLLEGMAEFKSERDGALESLQGERDAVDLLFHTVVTGRGKEQVEEPLRGVEQLISARRPRPWAPPRPANGGEEQGADLQLRARIAEARLSRLATVLRLHSGKGWMEDIIPHAESIMARCKAVDEAESAWRRRVAKLEQERDALLGQPLRGDEREWAGDPAIAWRAYHAQLARAAEAESLVKDFPTARARKRALKPFLAFAQKVLADARATGHPGSHVVHVIRDCTGMDKAELTVESFRCLIATFDERHLPR